MHVLMNRVIDNLVGILTAVRAFHAGPLLLEYRLLLVGFRFPREYRERPGEFPRLGADFVKRRLIADGVEYLFSTGNKLLSGEIRSIQ